MSRIIPLCPDADAEEAFRIIYRGGWSMQEIPHMIYTLLMNEGRRMKGSAPCSYNPYATSHGAITGDSLFIPVLSCPTEIRV